MKTDIWMPIYIKDYLASTSRLSTLEHGIYLLLLFDYWINGSLPNDMDILLQISKQPKDNLRVISGLLDRFFTLSENNLWVNKRIEIELERAVRNREIARENGKKGGRPRENNLPVNHPANPEITSSPSPSPSPVSIPKPLKAVSAKANTPQAKFIESFSGLYEKESGSPYKPDSKDFILVANLLKKYGDDVVINKARILFDSCRGRSAWFTENGMADYTIGNLSRNWNGLIDGGGASRLSKGGQEKMRILENVRSMVEKRKENI